MDAITSQSPPKAANGTGESLDSWKAIAGYLKRDQRTVRRWERGGLPVHRHMHKSRASVYAFKSEIDAWWQRDRVRLEAGEAGTEMWPLDNCRDDLQRLLGGIVRHRQHGADLVWEAYNVDIGGPE